MDLATNADGINHVDPRRRSGRRKRRDDFAAYGEPTTPARPPFLGFPANDGVTALPGLRNGRG
jgi:hypothetical protein